MKKMIRRFSNKILFPIAASVLVITGCNNDDTNPPSESGVGTSPDSAMMHTDSAVSDHTRALPTDTTSSMQITDSLQKISRDTAAKSSPGAKAKKGKVSVVAPDPKLNTAAMEMDKEGFYRNTEVLPAFPGGQKSMERFFEDNIVYPEVATENNTEGTVNLTFAVDERGKVYNPVVTGNTLGDGLEAEAIRVFNKMPTWSPGRIKGKNVKTRYTLPIRFQLY